MGHMRFAIPRPERLVPGAAEQAYLASADGIPWECQTLSPTTACPSNAIRASRAICISPGRLPAAGSCSSARAASWSGRKPYNLPVELARGTLNRIRNQASAWQSAAA